MLIVQQRGTHIVTPVPNPSAIQPRDSICCCNALSTVKRWFGAPPWLRL